MNKNNNFSVFNEKCAKKVISASNTDRVCLILISRIANAEGASFLYQNGIAPQVTQMYSKELFRYDPHVFSASSALKESDTYADYLQFEGYENRTIQKESTQEDAFSKYITYLKRSGIRQTAANISQISGGLFLVVGLLSTSSKQDIALRQAKKPIDQWVKDSSEQLLEHCVKGMYFSSKETESSHLYSLNLLTPREKDVAYCICQGSSNKKISQDLTVSEFTVENHLRNIYRKLEVRNRTALMAKLRNS